MQDGFCSTGKHQNSSHPPTTETQPWAFSLPCSLQTHHAQSKSQKKGKKEGNLTIVEHFNNDSV